jgi:alkylation response protein AidB-like acyl-CoA dehydrogenase
MAAARPDPFARFPGLGPRSVAFAADDEDGRRAAEAVNRALAYLIGGGTHEMQRNAVAERLLGLPR